MCNFHLRDAHDKNTDIFFHPKKAETLILQPNDPETGISTKNLLLQPVNMTSNTLDSQTREILSDLYHMSLRNNDHVDAVSYRVDHEDWIERLAELEQRRYIVLEGEHYRVSFGTLTLLDTEEANAELKRCERIFEILRDHFKNPVTRKTSKRVIELAEDLGVSYEETICSILYFLDATPFWSGGHSNNWEDRETANVYPSEEIIKIKSFSNLVSGVQRWFDAPRPLTSVADLFAGMSNVPPLTQEKRTELHPAPIVASFLYELHTDVAMRIIGRAGLSVDWTLTKDEGYSEKTRLRAYHPRIEAALRVLTDDQRLIVARNLVHGLLTENAEVLMSLNGALRRIGWKVVEGELTPDDVNLRELFFHSGAEHSAYVELRNILQRSKQEIFIVDPYLDGTIFTMLKTVPCSDLRVRILTNKRNLPSDFKLEAKKFEIEFTRIQLAVRTNNDFHDRFIILDEIQCFHIGASIKDAGKRAFMVSQLEDRTIASTLISFADEKWSHASDI
jgi:hypothetical protein